MIGNVVAVNNNAQISTDDDLTGELTTGDFIRLGGQDFGQEYTVKSITGSTIGLGKVHDEQCGPDAFNVGTCDDMQYAGDSSHALSIYKRKKVEVDYDIDAYDLDAALESLPGVGTVDVSRTGPDNQDGYVWTITFTSLNGPFFCPDYSSASVTPTTTSPCLVSQMRRGTSTLLLPGTSTPSVSTAFHSNLAFGNGILQRGMSPSFDVIAKSITVNKGTDEVQTLTTSADANDLGGTFTVTFDEASTMPAPPPPRPDKHDRTSPGK
jgi:hypothetical protein